MARRDGSAAKAGRELDALVLRVVMGWQWVQVDWPGGPARQLLWDTRWGRPRGTDFQELGDGRLVPWDAPRPSGNADAAHDVEKRLAERRLEYPYTVALLALLHGTGRNRQGDGWREAWSAATATPEQRCRAALRAVGYDGEDERPGPPARTAVAHPSRVDATRAAAPPADASSADAPSADAPPADAPPAGVRSLSPA